MKYLLAIISVVLLFFGHVARAGNIDYATVKATVGKLDKIIEHRQNFISGRQARIDSLCHELAESDADSLSLLMEIATAYTGFNNDSALHYSSIGSAFAKGTEKLPFRLKEASLMPLIGFFDAALQSYNTIDPDSVPSEMLAAYYDAGRQMYSYMAAFFKSYPDYAKPLIEREVAMQQKLLEVLDKESMEYRYNLAELYFNKGEANRARVLLEEIMDEDPAPGRYRARAAHHLSTLASDNNDENAYAYYLAESAISDVMSATREVASLQELGALMYAFGQVERSHVYLSNALANAVECGAPLRMIETSKILPHIERLHTSNIEASRKNMYRILVAMGILVFLLGLVLFLLRHEIKRKDKLQDSLRAANTAKEVYISQFLQLCSIYMDKLNQFCKIATRKLAARQGDELYRMTKSGKFVEEQSREFYEVFDNAFLHIYPDFVSDVNSLLRPDAQIELNEGELLNTDLRILAFLRLGIEEFANRSST